MHQQHQDYYRDVNQTHPQTSLPITAYNDPTDPRKGLNSYALCIENKK